MGLGMVGCGSEGVHRDGVVWMSAGSVIADEWGVFKWLFVLGSSVSIRVITASVELEGAPMEIMSAMRMACSMALEGELQEISDVLDLAVEVLWHVALMGLLHLGVRLCRMASRSSCLRSSLRVSFSAQRFALKSAISCSSLRHRVDLMSLASLSRASRVSTICWSASCQRTLRSSCRPLLRWLVSLI
jgi:hypothetical protein